MDVPCVRVPRERGEETRRRLAEADLVDHDHEIVVEDGTLYLPVTDAAAVPDEFDVVFREPPDRETGTAPADLLGFEPSYERIGDIVAIDEDDAARAERIADAVLDSDLPARAVIDRASKVKGETRVREWDIVADMGERSPTETVHREYGCEFLVDLAEVYFSPRLATERHRVAEQVEDGERAFDMFAGVGPFVIPFAKRGAEVVGTDLNERAIEYLRENARRNGVSERVTAIAGDVRDVVSGSSGATASDGVREVVSEREYGGWADRVVMNLPHSADDFLDTAVALAGDDCTLHYYDIQSEDDPFGPGEAAIREAAGEEYEVFVETCHTVRSYAPHELNVCLDVRLVRQ